VVGGLDVKLVGILGLIAVGIALTASPIVYQTVERFQSVIIAGVLVWLVFAILLGTKASAWATPSPASPTSARYPRAPTSRLR
jgi:cadmium resistance protein CadD (predicted permease)